MGFHIHRAERTDLLADGLAALLSRPAGDPFAPELVLVPARGVERWLSQRLSHALGAGTDADGVCAGVSFRSPRSLIAEIADATRDDAAGDPWAPEALTWPVMAAIDESLDQHADDAEGRPWWAGLAAHLGRLHDGAEAELRRGRRYAVARRLAGLFASYTAQRPQMPADWLAGDPTDGLGNRLDADLDWQPALWRAVVDRVCATRVGVEPPHLRHAATLARLRQGPVALPARLSLFGHTRLARTDIELLEALATHHELHLWLPHPSDDLWSALADRRGPLPRARDTGHHAARHPLLATLGRDLRELQSTLPGTGSPGVTDEDLGPPPRRDTLLSWLQADIAANAVRPDGRVLAAGDRSVQVHSCHGPARQVEVLRDVLLGALADDPTLSPRDILVMCPDIETYAPLIVAGFGLGEAAGGHPAHRLRVRLADRSPAQTNPLLALVAQVLGLVGGRASASEVLNIAEAPPVRARFGFTDDDIDVVTRWVGESGIRWGFDREHRNPFGLGDFVHNTWRFGLDRVLCGVAMSDDSQGWLDTTLPLDDVGSNHVDLAGRLAEFVDRLTAVADSLTGVRPLSEWLDLLGAGVVRLAALGADDGWQLGQLQREFADILEQAGSWDPTPMRLNDIRSLLERHLAGRPTRANFRSGTLTVCTMVPMRSVPHRVVCLVGLDDGLFPRQGTADGDDVLAREPVTGERDIRSEDRQLLLDAITATTERLVITYTGADEHTGRPMPPCVPLAEVLDTLDRTTMRPVRGGAGDGAAGHGIVVHHPLQPFDVRNVTPGALGTAGPFTFDPTALVAAEAAAGRSVAADASKTFLSEPLPAPPTGADVGLAELLNFFADPVRGFFRGFDVALPADTETVEDVIPVEIDALQAWAVGDRMLDDMLRGRDPQWALQAEWRRGLLPPGQLGWRQAKTICETAERLAATARGYRRGEPHAVDADIALRHGRRLTGTVSPIHADRIVSVTYSTLAAKHVLAAWIRLLVLAAAEPGRDWTAVCVGRSRRRVTERRFAAPRDPVPLLEDLAAIRDAGLREPLPLPLKTSLAWAEARHDRADPFEPARRAWASGRFDGEDAAAAQQRAWGGRVPLAELLGHPGPGEEVPGEATRLGALAARLWAPMLEAELEAD